MFRSDTNPTSREMFSSFQGVSFPLGTFKSEPTRKLEYKDNFLKHAYTKPADQLILPPSGLKETKFGKGFTRRQENTIKINSADSERNDYVYHQQEKAKISENLRTQRLEKLKATDNYTGYNIITGVIRNNPTTSPFNPSENRNHRELIQPSGTGIRYIPDHGIRDESLTIGKHQLRDSNARFYSPVPSGASANYRQDMLYREGLASGERYCGILDNKRKDIKSYGIEDQFSKNEYYKPSMELPPSEMSYGLYEKRLPGQFTPRNIPNHPSANPEVLHNWTTKADIYNSTTRNYLPQHGHHHQQSSNNIFGGTADGNNNINYQ
jgi:hypothetical protein